MFRRRVLIAQASIRQYRVAFYDKLKRSLAAHDVELVLAYGHPHRNEAVKGDARDIPWGIRVPTRYIDVANRHIVWQPIFSLARTCDLTIVEQASKHIANYALLGLQSIHRVRVAYWGHGKNFQSNNASIIGEVAKRWSTARVHWWFAYNDLSAQIVRASGYPDSRITSVNNAIDTEPLTTAVATTRPEDEASLRSELGIHGEHVCAFTGSLYHEKRLEFLLTAGDLLSDTLQGFELLVIGGGQQLSWLKEESARRKWLHILGPKFGSEQAHLLSMSRLTLCPGLVGLGILDAFAAEAPLVTTNIPYHSPEIAYLKSGVNGIMVGAADDPRAYARAVAAVLQSPAHLDLLREGCRAASKEYTLDNMVDRFTAGVLSALAASPLRGRK